MKPAKLLTTLSPRISNVQSTIVRDSANRMVERVSFEWVGLPVVYEQHDNQAFLTYSCPMPQCPPYYETGLSEGNRGYWLDFCNEWNMETHIVGRLYVEHHEDLDAMDPFQGNLVLRAMLVEPVDAPAVRAFVRAFLSDLDFLTASMRVEHAIVTGEPIVITIEKHDCDCDAGGEA